MPNSLRGVALIFFQIVEWFVKLDDHVDIAPEMWSPLAFGDAMYRMWRIDEQQQRVGAIFHKIYQIDLVIVKMSVLNLTANDKIVLELRRFLPAAYL